MAKSMSARKRRILLDELSFLSRGDYLEVKWLPTKTEPFLLILSLAKPVTDFYRARELCYGCMCN
jgi:hypothetical protein